MSGNLQKKKLLKHSETHGFAITVFARFSLNFILGCEHERIDLNQAEAPPGQSQENLLSEDQKRPFYPGFDLYHYSII